MKKAAAWSVKGGQKEVIEWVLVCVCLCVRERQNESKTGVFISVHTRCSGTPGKETRQEQEIKTLTLGEFRRVKPPTEMHLITKEKKNAGTGSGGIKGSDL